MQKLHLYLCRFCEWVLGNGGSSSTGGASPLTQGNEDSWKYIDTLAQEFCNVSDEKQDDSDTPPLRTMLKYLQLVAP